MLRSTIAARLPLERRQQAQRAFHRLKPPHWTYYADGLATTHYSPFRGDREFASRYEEMSRDWTPGEAVDARWRMWILVQCARQASLGEGDFAEYGVYRGGCSWMILSSVDLTGRRLHLFDTFAGIPHTNLTDDEQAHGMGGRLTDTSAGYVRQLLSAWDPIPALYPGDVFDTVPADIGQLAFAHIDLNAAAPTLHALKDVYGRLRSGGVIVFDDYGWQGYEDQRAAIDGFLSDKPETLIALPTGQAIVTKA